MLANIVEKWCLRGWYKNQKIPDLCGGAEQLRLFLIYPFTVNSKANFVNKQLNLLTP
ncbi:hypothetical protein [Endozoicomonas sp. SCSIO W0465]|uniref:hypothetical protein n=1 Tax=Endozoicomonas sp. SCSIO W0465 TaxID=2918516 RepID=UPI00207516F2|nr:hypothetical protein [Endozoicomonas sp. SCSIO W0465]USE36768.1 hypothetical protein MJO57_00540 [Endozoicomonas sp. SCSIO W0465]